MSTAATDQKRVLVVEDNEDTREILRALLTHHGYRTLETTTAEDMLERFTELRPDLLILDVRLPGMDGCEALERVRDEGFTGPAFLFSEYYDLISERVGACRHDGFYPKSRGPLQLIEAVRQRLKPTGRSD